MANMFLFQDTLTARADVRMHNDLVRNLFLGFTFGRTALTLTEGRECCFMIGDTMLPEIPCGAEYAISANENGIAVVGRDYPSLMRGYCALLQKIEYGTDGGLFVAEATEYSHFQLQNRMVHFCVFPETSMLDLKKFVRLAGILQYTHVVIEFWGMLRYDCESALAWPNAFTKDEAREVLREIRDFGMEAIPMLNHLGHATACRLASGKHVVLDQKPQLYPLFTPDGWSWNTENPDVWVLLKKARLELYELFGEGEYFHAGLDESYMYANDPALYAHLPAFLGRLTEEIVKEGRRPMIWMDMFLPPEAYGEGRVHACGKKTPADCMAVLDSLARETVLVDWQYGNKEAPIATSLYLKDKGFDIMGAPWLDVQNGYAHIDTAVGYGLFGVMETTWHTMAKETAKMLPFARRLGAAEAPWSHVSGYREEVATLLRKLMWETKTYEDCGWMKQQIVLGAEQTV